MADSILYNSSVTDLNIAQQNCLICIANDKSSGVATAQKYWCSRSGYYTQQSTSNNDLNAITNTTGSTSYDFIGGSTQKWPGYSIQSSGLGSGWYTGYNYDIGCMDFATSSAVSLTSIADKHTIMTFQLNSSANHGSITNSLLGNYLLFEIEYKHTNTSSVGVNVGLEIKLLKAAGGATDKWMPTEHIFKTLLGQDSPYFPATDTWKRMVFQIYLDPKYFLSSGKTATFINDYLNFNLNILIHAKSTIVAQWAGVRFRRFNVFTSMPTKAAAYYLSQQNNTSFVNADGSVNMNSVGTWNKLTNNEFANTLNVGLINSSINNSNSPLGTDKQYQVQAVSNLVNNNVETDCSWQFDLNMKGNTGNYFMSGSVYVGYLDKSSGSFTPINTTYGQYIYTFMTGMSSDVGKLTTAPQSFGWRVPAGNTTNRKNDSNGVSYVMKWNSRQIIQLLLTNSSDNKLYMAYKFTMYPNTGYLINSFSIAEAEFENSNYKLTYLDTDKTNAQVYNTAGGLIDNSSTNTQLSGVFSGILSTNNLIPIYTVTEGLKYANNSVGPKYGDIGMNLVVNTIAAYSRTICVDISGMSFINKGSYSCTATLNVVNGTSLVYYTSHTYTINIYKDKSAFCSEAEGGTIIKIPISVNTGNMWGVRSVVYKWRDGDTGSNTSSTQNLDTTKTVTTGSSLSIIKLDFSIRAYKNDETEGGGGLIPTE